MKIDYLSLNINSLKIIFSVIKLKICKVEQFFSYIHLFNFKKINFSNFLSKNLKKKLKLYGFFYKFKAFNKIKSFDGTRKYSYYLFDKNIIESVYIKNTSGINKRTLCISSQIGCAMGCIFCSTSKINFFRNLKVSEIILQIYIIQNNAWKKKSDEIVFMGSGEPLHNYRNILQSIKILTNEKGIFFSEKKITVSTCGILKNIIKVSKNSNINISISVNFSNNEKRQKNMPISKKWNLIYLLKLCEKFVNIRKNKLTLTYMFLKNINDSKKHTQKFLEITKNINCSVNLLNFNEHFFSLFKKISSKKVSKFSYLINEFQKKSFIRKTKGKDINAACGMLYKKNNL
jgi:23S rRNA (adenine2503-C2)-methyltransferase